MEIASIMVKFLFIIGFIVTYTLPSYSQSSIIKSIKDFGAKGDGKTNDTYAFQNAIRFFSKRKGNGKLVIPRGTYKVGKQIFNPSDKGRNLFIPEDVIAIYNFSNFTIEGNAGALLIYEGGLRFGSFDPVTRRKLGVQRDFYEGYKAAVLGYCIKIENSKNIIVRNLNLDGNLSNMNIGGSYGDVGTQLPHTGLYILNSFGVMVENMNVHHFGLDGITISNVNKVKDNIKLIKSRFEYNGRQGLSWVGGNGLYANGCSFSYSGMGTLSSPPGAGVDIEPEVGRIENGLFENCDFSNNTGCGVVADGGNSANCTFKNCTFNVKTNWAIWVIGPNYNFLNCKIYGPVVHGFKATSDADATKFIGCNFEDVGDVKNSINKYLFESNFASRILIKDCTIKANNKEAFWLIIEAANSTNEFHQVINNKFIFGDKAYIGTLIGVVLDKNKFYIRKNDKNSIDKNKHTFNAINSSRNINKRNSNLIIEGTL